MPPATTTAAVEAIIALAVEADLPALTERIVDATINRAFAAVEADGALRAAVRASVEDNLHALYGLIAGRHRLEDLHPSGALAFADTAVELDLAPRDLERAYRFGHMVVWEDWLARASALADTPGGPALGPLLTGPQRTIFAFVDHVLAEVFERYDERRADRHRTREQLRRDVVGRIVRGELPQPGAEVEATLGYTFAGWHIALHIERDGALAGAALDPAMTAAQPSQRLIVATAPGQWVLWLGRQDGFRPRRLTNVRRALEATTGTRAVLSDAAKGLAGFVRVHREVVATAALRPLLPEAREVLEAREVRLENLVLQDRRHARDFLEAELSELAGRSARNDRLCTTLRAWIATGSHTSAAALLAVHEHTVRNRIRQAEQLLGYGVAARRTELDVALRLRELGRHRSHGQGWNNAQNIE